MYNTHAQTHAYICAINIRIRLEVTTSPPLRSHVHSVRADRFHPTRYEERSTSSPLPAIHQVLYFLDFEKCLDDSVLTSLPRFLLTLDVLRKGSTRTCFIFRVSPHTQTKYKNFYINLELDSQVQKYDPPSPFSKRGIQLREKVNPGYKQDLHR